MSSISPTLSTTQASSLGTNHMNTTVGGLDIDALVSATIQAKSLPITLLQNKNSRLQSQLNDYNTIKSALNTLKYAVTDLTYSSAFSGRKATSTDEKVVTASAKSGSTNGSYVINVTSTATVTSNTSAVLGHAATKANVTGTHIYGGTLANGSSFTINGKTISVASSDTRDDVITKINAASAGVTASVASDGTVSITQNTAGTANKIDIGSDNSGFLANAGLSSGITAGTNDTGSAGSKAYITGTDVSGLNNQIDGVTIKAGTFYINSKRIDVTSTDTINTIVNKITASGAGVTATVSGGKVTITQNTAGKTPTIALGSDSTGFLDRAGIKTNALQQGIDPDEKLTFNDLFGSGNTTGMKGYFSINGTFFSVNPTEDSIDSIIQKINSSTTAGVTAVYNSATGTIALTSQTAGDEEIKLGVNGDTDDSNFLSKVGLIQGNQVTGKDAVVTVNGLSVTPVNNKVTFNDNTFTLVGKGTSTVTVEDDVDSIVTKVQDFITAYNSAIDAVYSKYNEGEGKNISGSSDASVGDLFGDPMLGNINTMMRNMTSSLVTTQPAGYQQLSQIGITNGKPGVYDIDQVKSGHLSLDTDKLKAALKSNTNAVASLLGNTTKSVTDEIVTSPNTPNGTTKDFTLQHGSISGDHRVFVDGVEYTEVSGTPKPYSATPTSAQSKNHEYSLDYKTGKITFGDAPSTGQQIKVSYNYDISATSSSSGLLIQMKANLESNTKYGGQFDAFTGTNGSITKEMNYNNERISDLQLRLQAEQATLYTKYQNMQTIYQTLQSQGSYMTSLLASLNKTSS